MSTFPWNAFTDRGNLMSTQLNSLADATMSAVSTALNNSTNKDTHAVIEVVLGSLNPAGSPYLEVYMIKALDGTNYEQSPPITGTDTNSYLLSIPVTTGTSVKRVSSGNATFELPPFPVQFLLGNQSGVALASSGNEFNLYTGVLSNIA